MASYTVRVGDTLSRIARDVLGDMGRWPELARLNGIAAPYTIYQGQVLQLYDSPPSDVPATSATPRARAPGVVSQSPWYKRPWVWFAVVGGLLLLEAGGGRVTRSRGSRR